ncbi:EpsG family protein [Aerococcus urinaeequi]|uniref:EpsG family protein n=1 Tax=Aerococcus urinaeequi TaxID=51665 RepID=A0AAE9XQ09_9LACT|nr:EpsG family protein [Aerococcus urinaeequi]WCG37218.1 EpsG family protein [Aerococcus urinaeequi]
MSVYLITLVLSLITSTFSYYYKDKQKIISIFFLVLTLLILGLISGLRWGVFGDYFNYANNYIIYKNSFWESLITFNEPGIRFIAYISQYIYDDYATMFLICSLLTISLFIIPLYKHSDYFFISILLYIFIGAWHGSFNGVRQYIASAIIFFGHRLIYEKKFWKYLIVVIVASLFHSSAMIMILLYFVPKSKLNFIQIIIFLLLIIITLSSYNYIFEFIEIFFNRYRSYNFTITEYVTNDVSIARIAVMLTPVLVYLGITPKKFLDTRNHNENPFYINLLFVNAAVYLMTANSSYLARFGIYTTIFLTIGIPKLFLQIKRKYRYLYYYFTIILFFFYWIYDILGTPDLLKFKWIFER